MEHQTVPTVIRIISFGYLHGDGEPPSADVTLDLRHHFRDPHINPALRYMTADDTDVREAVRKTPGILPLIAATCALAQAYLQGPNQGLLTIAVGCAGGRHRAAAVGMELASILGRGREVELVHRDLAEDVVEH